MLPVFEHHLMEKPRQLHRWVCAPVLSVLNGAEINSCHERASEAGQRSALSFAFLLQCTRL